MKIRAILEKLEVKTFEKDGKTIVYHSALVTFDGQNYSCFINCRLSRPYTEYKVGDIVDIDISLHAFNWKPVVKYILN